MSDQEAEDRLADEVRQRHPEWDIKRVFGGWLAAPRGTRVVRRAHLESIDAELTLMKRGEP